MDIGKALSFVTEDERWMSKIGIGAVVVLACILTSFLIIPIFLLGMIMSGYTVKTARNVMDGVERPLPEWENWGQLLSDGFAVFVAGIVYTLPVWLLACCATLFIVPLGNTSGGDAADIMAGIGFLGITVVSCLIFLVAIALMLIYPAIIIQYARIGELSATFQFSKVLEIARENIGDIVITLLVVFGVSFVISLVGAIPLIGWIVALAGQIYLIAVQGHLYGQIGTKVGGSPKEDKFAME